MDRPSARPSSRGRWSWSEFGLLVTHLPKRNALRAEGIAVRADASPKASGFLALNYGRRTPLVALLAHVIYGAILGAFYHLASHLVA